MYAPCESKYHCHRSSMPTPAFSYAHPLHPASLPLHISAMHLSSTHTSRSLLPSHFNSFYPSTRFKRHGSLWLNMPTIYNAAAMSGKQSLSVLLCLFCACSVRLSAYQPCAYHVRRSPDQAAQVEGMGGPGEEKGLTQAPWWSSGTSTCR